MRTPLITLVSALAICLALGSAAAPQSAMAEVEVKNCLVSAIDDVEVPAREAGVLVELPVKPGQQVKEGDVLGKVDDSRAIIELELAQLAHDEAVERYGNDINVRYAMKEAAVAESEYKRAKDANAGVGGAVSQSELKTKELDHQRAVLQVEQANVTQGLIKYEVRSAVGQVNAARQSVERRLIVSKIEGEVFEVHRNRGEWVEPRDAVVRVVRMNQLQIIGFLKESDHARSSVINRPIEVEVAVDGERVEKFRGKIVFASSETTGGGQFRVTAEVDNRKKNGLWLLKPGQDATMTIQ